MRATMLCAVAAGLFWGTFPGAERASRAGQKDDPKDAKGAAKEGGPPTPAAQLTRNKALRAKMTVSFTVETRLGDVLKEFAAQVDKNADIQLLWTYGDGFPYARKVKYSCKDKPLEVALDELFKKAGGLGYIVVSRDGDRHDGWVLLTATGERGTAKGVELPAGVTEVDETNAADKLALAKKYIDAGMNEQAKTVLAFVVKRYPGAKATAEAKELLMKLEK